MKKTFGLRTLLVLVLIVAIGVLVFGTVNQYFFSPKLDSIIVSPPKQVDSEYRIGTAFVCGHQRPLVALIDEVSANLKCEYLNLPSWFQYSKRTDLNSQNENGILVVNGNRVFPKRDLLIVFVAKNGKLVYRKEVEYDRVKQLFRDSFYLTSPIEFLSIMNEVDLK